MVQPGIVWTMTREWFVKILKAVAVAILLFLLLFAESLRGSSYTAIGSVLREITAVLQDSETQWMLFVSLGIYFTAFLFFRYRASPGFWRAANPHLWLACALVIVAVLYAIDYVPSTQALTLLGGAVLGQGMGFWARLEMQNVHHVERGKKFTIQNSLVLLVVSILVILLAGAPVLHAGFSRTFEYHSQARWSSVWDNPNIFGLLMGTGVLIALGLTVASFRLLSGRIGKWSCALLCLLAAILMRRGLLHSYSRGAWLATVCGGVYLLWHWMNREMPSVAEPQEETNWPQEIAALPSGTKGIEPRISRIARMANSPSLIRVIREIRGKKCWLLLSVVLSSAVILAFWHFRGTDWHPARRAFSSVNAADFSWRNRIAAWEGALQITADHPLFGAAWGQPEPLYGHYYLPPKLNETGAIELNDYLMLVATNGIPALFCFGMYIWLALKRKVESGKHPPSRSLRQTGKTEIQDADWLKSVCYSGAIVLLVGFWFDGGLFKLPTAATFWILLELGAAEPSQPHAQTDSPDTKSHEDVS
jgi:uncharacterized membrane protein YsdA (DUF1294 family)